MEKYAFIFSNERRYRLQRHGCFWAVWWLTQSLLYSFAGGFLNASYFRRLPVSMLEAFVFLVPHLFLAYSLMYFVVPRLLLKAKYGMAAVAALLLFLFTGVISSVISLYLLVPLRTALLGRFYVPPVHINELHFFLGLMAGLRGATTVGGIAAAIKLMKYWYVKEQRNLQLQKENVDAQLQLLKAQVHPHFLFNTLNNIYASAQVSSPKTAGMIMGLSNLLRYMLYECNQPAVPLSRELLMLQEYIELEKNRYGNDLDINVQMPATESGYLIAPLLLLPFVENSFKHGTSQMLEQPWISLSLTVEEDWLKMKLVNGKTDGPAASRSGIGLQNVQMRLQLLYPKKHELTINNEEEVFIVNLKIGLQKKGARTMVPVAATAETHA